MSVDPCYKKFHAWNIYLLHLTYFYVQLRPYYLCTICRLLRIVVFVTTSMYILYDRFINMKLFSHYYLLALFGSNVNDDICSIEDALSVIAESAMQIVEAITAFTSQKVINWQRVLEKLNELGISQCDVMYIMQLFEKDKELARMFLGITDEAFMRYWVYDKLAQSPPRVHPKILH